MDHSRNVEKHLALSTAHMPSPMPKFGDVRYEDHEYGYVVWFTDEPEEGAPWLRPILTIARDQGCNMVIFDRDALTLDGIKDYEW